jgi:hypothetical protein
MGRETEYGPVDRSVGVLWIVLGAHFLGSSGICPNLLMTRERLLCIDCVRYVWSGTIHGLSVGCVWRAGRVLPCRVYIDLKHRDSQIGVIACLVVVFMWRT